MSKLRQILDTSYCRYYSVQRAKKKLPIIACKRPEFNHYEGQTYSKFDGIKLASSGWNHPKSKQDYFIIHGNANNKEEPPVYKKTFEEIGLDPRLTQVMLDSGYNLPTAIQAKAIPSILTGHNTVVTAETGCGKTLAYLLPIFQHILEWKPSVKEDFNSPLAVIVTPSRELASQIGEVAQNLAQTLNINVTTLIGGKTKQKMINPPIEYCDVLVTTLGAYSKLVTTGIYKIQNVHHVVLDEADTLLDDSFIEKVANLMKKFPIQYKVEVQVPPDGCQLTLVSATMPQELPTTVNSFVAPESLKTVTTSRIHRLLPHIPHKFLRLGKAQKPAELLKIVQADVNMKRPVMIFSNQTSTCDFVSMFLNENNVECININGRMAVPLKIGKFEQYNSGRVNVLSCTDIASRGLDTLRILKKKKKSAVVEHSEEGSKHYLRFDKPQILAKEHRYLPRMIREAIEIKKHPNFNREDGWKLAPAWDPVSHFIKSEPKKPAARPQDTTQHVINYDFPLYTADYIHRCGRTGRIGSPEDCSVTNFVAWPREIHMVQKIEESVRKHGELPNVNANIRRIIQDRIVKMGGLFARSNG